MTIRLNSIGSWAAAGLAALALGAPTLVAGCAAWSPPAEAQVAQAQNVVVHIGDFTNDLHSTFMGLNLATNLQKRGARVTVFLDREGVRLADARERGDLTWGDSGPVSAAMEAFVAAGGTVLVCPHCAELAGIAAKDLRSGAKMGSHDAVADLFLAADKVIDF